MGRQERTWEDTLVKQAGQKQLGGPRYRSKVSVGSGLWEMMDSRVKAWGGASVLGERSQGWGGR